jgi:hypothetical protein
MASEDADAGDVRDDGHENHGKEGRDVQNLQLFGEAVDEEEEDQDRKEEDDIGTCVTAALGGVRDEAGQVRRSGRETARAGVRGRQMILLLGLTSLDAAFAVDAIGDFERRAETGPALGVKVLKQAIDGLRG